MENRNFKLYSKYYDLLYSDKDYQTEVDYICRLLDNYSQNKCEILEFGSGTGKHGSLLYEKGFKVTGIEKSKEMVEIATKISGANFLEGDIRKIQLNQKFDAILSLFHVLSYQVNNKDVKLVLENASKHLKKGGLFIFDVWYSPAVYNLKPSVRMKNMSNDKIDVIRIANPIENLNLNRVDVHYTIFVREKPNKVYSKLKEIHPMRHFSNLELELFAENTGFEVLKSEEFSSGNKLSNKTWSACFILRKI